MAEDHRLEELLDLWEENRAQGRDIPAEKLCRDCPELLPQIRRKLRALRGMGWLEGAPPGIHSQSTLNPGAEESHPQNKQARVPETLGEYTLLEPIGAGGMGQVFKARHRRMDRIVALKVLSPQTVSSVDSVRRFQREVKAAAKLVHPNIVTAYDAGESGDIHFLVMEFVDGTDLHRYVNEHGPMAVEQTVDCILQAARGLEYAHRQGVIHRDIKPGNLLLTPDGAVKILDMGLARLDSSGGDEPLTGTGVLMGTVDYLAPEQADNAGKVDHRADIYSLGCTLYFLLTGHAVYKGKDTIQKIMAHLNAPIPSLRDARPEAPRALDAIFQEMVAKDAEQRYQSMTKLVNSLTRLRNERSEDKSSQTKNRFLSLRGAFLAGSGAVLLGMALFLGRAFFGPTKLGEDPAKQAKLPHNTTPELPTDRAEALPERAKPTSSFEKTKAPAITEKASPPVESKPLTEVPDKTKRTSDTSPPIEPVLANPSAYDKQRLSFDHLRLIALDQEGRLGHRALIVVTNKGTLVTKVNGFEFYVPSSWVNKLEREVRPGTQNYPVRITCTMETWHAGNTPFWRAKAHEIQFYGTDGTIQKSVSEDNEGTEVVAIKAALESPQAYVGRVLQLDHLTLSGQMGPLGSIGNRNLTLKTDTGVMLVLDEEAPKGFSCYAPPELAAKLEQEMKPDSRYRVRIICKVQRWGGRNQRPYFWRGRVQEVQFYGLDGTIQKIVTGN
jgi:serine/threonine protein kinase